jgi:CubicO group peptidase (beta-lactamase class C family)
MTMIKKIKNMRLGFIGLLLALVSICSSCDERKGRSILIQPQVQVDSTITHLKKLDNVAMSPKTNLVDSFFTGIHKNNEFNGTVLVVDNGEVIYRKAFGYSNFKTKDSLSPYSVFQLASVSKQFTAISILQLYEQGKLSLQDPVVKFFPDFPYKNITLQLLLSHRSGLPNYVYFSEEYYTEKNKLLTNAKLMELLAVKKPALYFEPDKKFNYCNTNYCILASVVEKVSGVSFADYVSKNLLEKVGLDYSFIASPKTATQKKLLVTGYDENNLESTPNYMDGLLGDKGVYSSVVDLKKWDDALYSGAVIQLKTLQLAMKPANNDMIGGRNYGYGWRIKMLADNTPVYYHGGWWRGFNTYSMRNPKDRSAIIILSNHVNGSFNNITSFIPVFYNQKKVAEPETI